MTDLKKALMEMGYDELDAELAISDAKAQLQDYLDAGDMDAAENICEEMFGLEPDFIMDLFD